MKRHLLFSAILFVHRCFGAEAASVPLFNGTDLSGWKGTGYIVEDGAIVSTPQGKNLVSEQTFSNYVLDFEFKLPPGGNNGIGIHYPGEGDGAYTGMEIQILDNSSPKYKDLKDAQFNGSLYTLAPAKKSGLKPVGEWNRERVSVLGSTVLVELNGEAILRANLNDIEAANPAHEGVKRRAGHIAWLGHGDRVAFRNIRITEVPPAANVDGVRAAGFTQIFDGKTLNTWMRDALTATTWLPTNGILKHTGKPDATDLWTEKEYANFTLVFDWRWSGRGPMKAQPIVLADGSNKINPDGQPSLVEIEDLDSGIYLRGSEKSQVKLWNWTVGSGEIHGYRTDATLPPEVRALATPKVHADRPPGEWNRTMITLIGDRITVSLNGRVVIDNALLPGIPVKGPIGLQHHGTAIDFANLWIKEL